MKRKNKPKVGEVWLVKEGGFCFGHALVVVKELGYTKGNIKGAILDCENKHHETWARESSIQDEDSWMYFYDELIRRVE